MMPLKVATQLEDCLFVRLSVRQSVSVSMHSHSFQDTKLKLCRLVKDYPEQVIEGLTILGVTKFTVSKIHS